MTKRIFTVNGMHCAACAAATERMVKKLPGCGDVYVNFAAGELSVTGSVPDEDICKAVAKAGFSAVPRKEDTPAEPQKKNSGASSPADLLIVWLCGAAYIILHHSSTVFSASPLLQLLLLLPILYAGRHFFLSGIPALFRGTPDMNSLVGTGVVSALLYSSFLLLIRQGGQLYFDAAGMIIVLIMTGKFLEGRSRQKAADAVRELTALVPEKALVITENGEEKEFPLSALRSGMKCRVLPGMKIPADGRVLEGNSGCDESMFTGEPLPSVKSPGYSVTGGSINKEGVLVIKVENSPSDSTLARIIAMVRDAQGSRAPIARIADRAASYFVWSVLAAAAMTFTLWAIFGPSVTNAVGYALGVLVVACPCSLGLATPIALIAGIGQGAKLGLLIKNGAVLEEMEKVKAVIFDKTGTLTSGVFTLEKISCADGISISGNDLLVHAAALEKNSSHPLAAAVTRKAADMGLSLPEVSGAVNMPGIGIKGVIAGETWEIVRAENSDDISGSFTCAVLKKSGIIQGTFLFRDKVKKEGAESVKALKKIGVRVEMLTGDNCRAAAAAAAEAGVDGFHAELLPGDKSRIIREIQQQYGKTAMVGDGVNDAPALAAADIGIAMGSGTSAAIEAADVVLLSGNLNAVPGAFSLSRATMHIIRQNLFWAFAYNAVGIPLAAGVIYALTGTGQLTPVFCAAAMGASSLTVVLNALRLRCFKVTSGK